jgi:hypothetical protein
LCDPDIAVLFDGVARKFAPGHTPFEYRWSALTIRKRASQGRELASRYLDWLDRKLPEPFPLDRCDADRWEHPGVYIVFNATHPLYVGESHNLRARIQGMRGVEGWATVDARSVVCIPTDEPRYQHGLQSMLIYRLNPMLNSTLLRPAAIEQGNHSSVVGSP